MAHAAVLLSYRNLEPTQGSLPRLIGTIRGLLGTTGNMIVALMAANVSGTLNLAAGALPHPGRCASSISTV